MTIFPEKISIRLIILLSLLFVSVLGLIKTYYEEKKPSPNRFISSRAPTQRPISTPNPTSLPTPTPIIRSFSSARQNISVTIPKYWDVTDERETYEISFDKITADSRFYISKEAFSPLTIFDENYKFIVQIAKEVAPDHEELEKTFTEVNTNQFGLIKKYIIGADSKNRIIYRYFTDFYTVKIFPEQKEMPSRAFMSCSVTGEDQGECDKLISTLSIKLK